MNSHLLAAQCNEEYSLIELVHSNDNADVIVPGDRDGDGNFIGAAV